MKKLFCIILFMEIIPMSVIAATSSNSFEIELKEVLVGNPSITHSGLSDGAVTAIALGSSFGGLGLISGIGYYFFKHFTGMTCGFACGEKCPYQLVDIDNPDFITKSKHSYLIKAYEYAQKDKDHKYLIIPDTQIKPNTYNTVIFEIPENFVGTDFEIIQSSAPLSTKDNISELDSDIFFNNKKTIKIPTSSNNSDLSKGILTKQGKIKSEGNKIFALTTFNRFNELRTYAIIVVFRINQ